MGLAVWLILGWRRLRAGPCRWCLWSTPICGGGALALVSTPLAVVLIVAAVAVLAWAKFRHGWRGP